MHTLHLAAWLAVQAGSVLRYLWFVSLPVTVLAFGSLAWLYSHRPLTRGALLVIYLCGAFPAVMLTYGAFFWVNPAAARTDTTARVVVTYAALLLFVGSFIGAVAIARGQRLAAMALASLGCWLGLCASFVAGMAVTGDWL